MRNRHLILLLSILFATLLVAGCGSQRQLTKGETDQFNVISGKIAQAEGMTPGAKACAPKELAFAKAEKDLAYHETVESWENNQAYIARADKAADAVLAKTKACVPPVVKFSANPAEIAPGKCSTLTWSSENVKKAEIDQGVGAVAASGSKEVCPKETTQYLLTATGTGGTVYEEATVTVSAPAPPPPPPPSPAPAPAPAPAPERKVIDRLTIRVNFDFDKSTIRKADVPELEKAVAFVKKYPDAKVAVEGHTDSKGTDKYNLKLSQRRADAVKKYLVDKGEKADRITAEGKGEAYPIADNKTEKGRFENRRVEVLIIEK
jgi:outer membrane protein OmpA-like peptidoglycan-associated protein